VRGDDESRHPLTAQGGAHTVAVKQDTQLDSDRANATLLHASAVSTESLTAFTPGIMQIRIDGPPSPKLAPVEQPIRDESSLSVTDSPTRRIGTDLTVKNGSPKASSASLSQTQTTEPSETSAAAGSLLPLRREFNSTFSTSNSSFDDARVTELKHQLLQSNNLAAKLSQSVRDNVKEIGWSGAVPCFVFDRRLTLRLDIATSGKLSKELPSVAAVNSTGLSQGTASATTRERTDIAAVSTHWIASSKQRIRQKEEEVVTMQQQINRLQQQELSLLAELADIRRYCCAV